MNPVLITDHGAAANDKLSFRVTAQTVLPGTSRVGATMTS